MSWLASLLTALVLLQSGAGICPMAEASVEGATSHACADTPAHVLRSDVHNHDHEAHKDHTAMVQHAPSADGHACEDACGGGAACADCALLSAVFTPALSSLPHPAPELVRVYDAHSVLSSSESFDPPPPKA